MSRDSMSTKSIKQFPCKKPEKINKQSRCGKRSIFLSIFHYYILFITEKKNGKLIFIYSLVSFCMSSLLKEAIKIIFLIVDFGFNFKVSQ
jgi:hypothetical protein